MRTVHNGPVENEQENAHLIDLSDARVKLASFSYWQRTSISLPLALAGSEKCQFVKKYKNIFVKFWYPFIWWKKLCLQLYAIMIGIASHRHLSSQAQLGLGVNKEKEDNSIFVQRYYEVRVVLFSAKPFGRN